MVVDSGEGDSLNALIGLAAVVWTLLSEINMYVSITSVNFI